MLPRWGNGLPLDLGNLGASFPEFRPCRAMDGAVDAAPTEHALVGCVDDGVAFPSDKQLSGVSVWLSII